MRLLVLSLVLLFVTGCSLPRVIVLNDPLDASGHNDLGVSYQVRGDKDLALRSFERAAELDKGWALPLINRGNVLALQENWAEAAGSYLQALRREPQNAEAMNNLAWVLLASGDAERALPWAEEAVALDPLQPVFLDTLADIRLARGEERAAALLLDRALQNSPAPELRQALEAKRATIPSSHP
jgi:Flp pilus assembly protein TadD